MYGAHMRAKLPKTPLLIGLAACCAAATAAPAASAAPTATTVAAAGLRISWPAVGEQTVQVAPGSTHRITVKRTGQARRATRAQITVTRTLPGTGAKAKTIVRRTVRQGRVTLRLSKRAFTAYDIVVQVGQRTWRHRLQVAGPKVPPADVGPAPSSPPAPLTCEPSAGLTLPATAVIGQQVEGTLTNASAGQLVYGADGGWERLVDGAWTTDGLPAPLAVPAIAYYLGSGRTTAYPLWIWDALTPGVYRIRKRVACQVVGIAGPAPGVTSPETPVSPFVPLYSTPITVTAPASAE